MGICLSQDLVESYVTGTCSADEQQVVESHLTECDSCRQKMESIRLEISNRDRSDTTNTQKNNSGDVIDKTQVFQDETLSFQDNFPTKSMPQVTSLPYEKDNFARSLGAMIEGYEITDELPRGGQAAVYKAVHTATKTNVAIKVLLPTMLA